MFDVQKFVGLLLQVNTPILDWIAARFHLQHFRKYCLPMSFFPSVSLVQWSSVTSILFYFIFTSTVFFCRVFLFSNFLFSVFFVLWLFVPSFRSLFCHALENFLAFCCISKWYDLHHTWMLRTNWSKELIQIVHQTSFFLFSAEFGRWRHASVRVSDCLFPVWNKFFVVCCRLFFFLFRLSFLGLFVASYAYRFIYWMAQYIELAEKKYELRPLRLTSTHQLNWYARWQYFWTPFQNRLLWKILNWREKKKKIEKRTLLLLKW